MHPQDDGKNNLPRLHSDKDRPENKVSHLPLAGKIMAIRYLPPKEQLERIITDPEANRIVQALHPQELYWLVKEIGESDSLELLALAAPEQAVFFLDMECWNRDEFLINKFLDWLGYLLEGGEKTILDLVSQMDMELLTLILMKSITVGGGIGEMISDEERETNWDHTFDNCFYINFKNSQHATLIGKFLDIIYRNNNSLYLALMESVRAEIPGEIEELSYQFRTGRLADHGFPAYDEALSMYSYLDPATYTPPVNNKMSPAHDVVPALLPARLSPDTLLHKALAQAQSEELLDELQCLCKNAVVAEGVPVSAGETMHEVFQRIYGYLNISLQYFCADNTEKAVELLKKEHLAKLFQLGRSIILTLRKKADKSPLENNDLSYAANKVLLGLRAQHPKFYRGLDPDMVDGYREFRDLLDIKKLEAFLAA